MARRLRALAVFILIVMAAAGGAGALMYERIRAPYRGYEGSERFVDLPTGAGSRTIGERLVDAGIVSDHLTFRLALWQSGQGRHLKAGEYRFDRAMTPFEVIDKLVRGDVYVINVTFPEGLTIAEMAAIFEAHGFGPRASFIAAAQDPSPIQHVDAAATNLEGYLFPETYPLSRHTDAATLVRLMVARFEHVLTPEWRQAAEARHVSMHQLVTLASIVEKETARPDERPIVAAVYDNRLRIGMPLQCDPTVIFALQRAGRYDGNLRHDDLAFDSPYNTYRYAGLPPGPIASPGRASIEAALHPAAADFLYFVSRNDGSHEFAKSLADHNKNVQKYQVQYFKDRKAGRAGEAGRSGETGRSGRR
ncbi:MAG: endolytic transglycosylase MltG [Acidobacteriia bacterium]|nr:endolytic transglycosylase MltG [Terriglobia bacterium]